MLNKEICQKVMLTMMQSSYIREFILHSFNENPSLIESKTELRKTIEWHKDGKLKKYIFCDNTYIIDDDNCVYQIGK